MSLLKIKNSDVFAIVKDKHYERLSQYEWTSINGAICRIEYVGYGRKYIPLSKEVMCDFRKEVMYDHKDRNPLNNDEDNLRLCSRQQNNYNKTKKKNSSSKYIGVTWHKRRNKWKAQIMNNFKNFHLGMFEFEIEAALAYDKAAKIFAKEFANFNFIIT